MAIRKENCQCDVGNYRVKKRTLYPIENFEMKDDEITLKGFLDLNMMEAQDSDGDPNDLWVTLESMGYNKALELDQVSTTLDFSLVNTRNSMLVIHI